VLKSSFLNPKGIVRQTPVNAQGDIVWRMVVGVIMIIILSIHPLLIMTTRPRRLSCCCSLLIVIDIVLTLTSGQSNDKIKYTIGLDLLLSINKA
jgi:hypothetical protein